jgi:hypothetical protein
VSYDSDMQQVVKRAQEQGFRYRTTERNHHQFYAPNGHDIVVAPGTPSDQRGWNNFMADMKRAGYRVHDASTSLGDVLREAGVGQAQERQAATKASVRQLLREYLQARPGQTVPYEELEKLVSTARPDLNYNAAAQTLSVMVTKGELVRVKVGWYRAVTDEDRRQVETPQTNGAAGPPVVAPQPTAPPVLEPPATSSTDSDIAELDDAVTKMLDAFSTVERLLRKHRETMKKVAELKKLLSGGGL